MCVVIDHAIRAQLVIEYIERQIVSNKSDKIWLYYLRSKSNNNNQSKCNFSLVLREKHFHLTLGRPSYLL